MPSTTAARGAPSLWPSVCIARVHRQTHIPAAPSTYEYCKMMSRMNNMSFSNAHIPRWSLSAG
eukprot:818123-Pelagomonas_calceolata.AAC.1